MKATERVLRAILQAPVVDITYAAIDHELPGNCIYLSGAEQTQLGVGPGDQVMIRSGKTTKTVLVLDGDTAISISLGDIRVGKMTVRRKLGPIVLKELLVLSLTIVGMLIVVLTLSGDMQKIAAILSVLGLLGHFFSLRLFRR
jgi:hypothetical protein